jgi:hypothetical protein
MNTVKMIQFGAFLTGREFGQKAMKELEPHLKFPVTLDFSGNVSLGSSFGDEVVPPIAKKQGGQITVLNPNQAIWDCLMRIAAENKIEIFRA